MSNWKPENVYVSKDREIVAIYNPDTTLWDIYIKKFSINNPIDDKDSGKEQQVSTISTSERP